VHGALFPDLGPEPVEDDFAAEITRLCRGALRMYGDAAVRESIPDMLNDLRSDRRMRRVLSGGAWYAVCVRRIKDVDTAAKELRELVLRGVLA